MEALCPSSITRFCSVITRHDSVYCSVAANSSSIPATTVVGPLERWHDAAVTALLWRNLLSFHPEIADIGPIT